MQITIDFAQVSMPSYEPYAKNEPERQRENLAYVALQLMDQARQSGVKLTYSDDDESPIGLRLDGVQLATQDGSMNAHVLDFGAFQIRFTNYSAEVLAI